jgi:hypothetical protein
VDEPGVRIVGAGGACRLDGLLRYVEHHSASLRRGTSGGTFERRTAYPTAPTPAVGELAHPGPTRE